MLCIIPFSSLDAYGSDPNLPGSYVYHPRSKFRLYNSAPTIYSRQTAIGVETLEWLGKLGGYT